MKTKIKTVLLTLFILGVFISSCVTDSYECQTCTHTDSSIETREVCRDENGNAVVDDNPIGSNYEDYLDEYEDNGGNCQ